MKPMVSRNWRLEPELVEALEALADAGKMSVNEALRIVLKKGLKALEEAK